MPDRTAVYRIYDEADSLLYVGVASSFGRRWSQHSSKQEWWPMVHRQTVTWYGTREDAEAAETVAIRDEKPVYNVMPGNLTRSRGVTPNRPIRIEPALWDRFGASVGVRQRSEVLREFIRWHLGDTDQPPARMADRAAAG